MKGLIWGHWNQVTAVRNNGGIIIAQVKRQVAAGSLNQKRCVYSGCTGDYRDCAPEQTQTTQTQYEPAISGEISRPLSAFRYKEHGPARVIAQRVAQELQSGRWVNIGFGISAQRTTHFNGTRSPR